MTFEDKFLFFPKINLDIDQLRDIVFLTQFCSDESADASHHRTVKNYAYLQSIQDQYPFLSDIYNIYTLPPKKNIPLHVDARRNVAFNIPIKNTEKSKTIFYEYVEEPVFQYDNKNIFIAKMNEVGNWLWATKITTSNNEEKYSIKALSDDSIIIAGTYNSSIIFGKFDNY